MNWTNMGEVSTDDFDGYQLLLSNGITIYVTDEELDLLNAGEKLASSIARRYPVADEEEE